MKVSVCICTCNRPALLQRLLESLGGMELGSLDPGNVDIIVIDNNPTGQAAAVCERASGDLPVALRFAEETQRGISFARNRAVDEALGGGADHVAFIDDDDIPEPDWLIRLLDEQKQTEADIVLGIWRWAQSLDVPSWSKGLRLFDPPCRNGPNRFGVPKQGTGNVLIGKRILQEMASSGTIFSPEFALTGGEDRDFAIRALRSGATFVTTEKSVINRGFEFDRLTVGGVLKRGFRSGNIVMRLEKKFFTPDRIRRSRRNALKKVFLGLVSMPAHVFSKRRLVRKLYKISQYLGMLYASVGKRYSYYL